MRGILFSAHSDAQSSPFETLLGLFKEVIVHTSGDVDEALDWLRQLDQHYNITNDEYTFEDFIQELKDRDTYAIIPTVKVVWDLPQKQKVQFERLRWINSSAH